MRKKTHNSIHTHINKNTYRILCLLFRIPVHSHTHALLVYTWKKCKWLDLWFLLWWRLLWFIFLIIVINNNTHLKFATGTILAATGGGCCKIWYIFVAGFSNNIAWYIYFCIKQLFLRFYFIIYGKVILYPRFVCIYRL